MTIQRPVRNISQLPFSRGVLVGARTLVGSCADLRAAEPALVISDPSTADVGEAIASAALEVSPGVVHVTVPALDIHGQEPPPEVADRMKSSPVIFCVTAMSMAHTQARYVACENGGRFLSLPGYTLGLLESPSLRVDFRALTGVADALAHILGQGQEVTIRTGLGTDIRLNVGGRHANSCPGWCQGPNTLASPPDAETNIAPLEAHSEGVLVVDGSILCPEMGVLDSPLTLFLEAGAIARIAGPAGRTLEAVLSRNGSPAARILGEFGIGLNPSAELKGVMLEDEGCRGTIHFGFGSNSTVGGKNRVNFHLDMTVRKSTVAVDGRTVIKEGELCAP